MNNSFGNPELVWVVKPETKIRFRYESEGGSHGGLAGKEGKKSYPTLELKNYHGRERIFVRVSLCTEDKKEHVLEFKGKKNEGNKRCIEEPIQDDNRVVFKNLHILSKKKDVIEQILMERKLRNLRDGMSRPARVQFEKRYSKEVKDRARAILNSARLYFQAFEDDGSNTPLCSLFSDVICNQKAASKGDLRICRLSHIVGSWKGGDEVILLCEKVQKDNIKVKFYETRDGDKDGFVIWEKYGDFKAPDVHYQVAIPFKTPAYPRNEEKKVFIVLERNGEMSDPREFTYKPDDEPSSKKRKYELETLSNPMSLEPASIFTPETPESVVDTSSPECSNVASSEMSSFFRDISSYDSSQSEMNEDLDFNGLLDYICPEDDGSANLLFQDYRHPFIDSLGDILVNHDARADEYYCVIEEHQLPQNTFATQIDGVMIDNVDAPRVVGNGGVIGSENLSSIDIDVGLKNLTLKEDHIKDCDCCKSGHSRNLSSLQLKKKVCSRFLLKRDNCGNTLLHMAVLLNKSIIPILKMSHFAKIDLISVQNYKKQTPLHLAVEKNKCEAVKILLKRSSNPNFKDSNGNNCYHLAAKNNFPSVLSAISKYSQFPHKVIDFNDEGLTPLHLAVMQNNPALFNLLKMHVTDINIMEKKAGKSILHYVIDFQPFLLSEILEMVNINVNIQDFEGNTPLHIACAYENIEAVKKLLQSKANPSIKNFKQNLEENLEDDTPVGQLPEDLTTNFEILTLLREAWEALDREVEDSLNIQIPACLQELDEISCPLTELMCEYLDKDMKWKELVPFFLDDDVVESLSLGHSPSRALLDYIKKEEKDNYLESLRRALEFANLREGVDIITEYQLKEIMNE